MFMLLGLTKRSYRYTSETENDIMPEIPFLGVLPELVDGGPHGERALAAAHAVHQIRVSIQSRMRHTGAVTYAITSAMAGEGKTGLTMALGLSFASARMRTLVIDCDMIGRHLTSRLGAKDSPGLKEAMEAGSIREFYHELEGGLAALTAGQGTPADAYAMSAAQVRSVIEQARRDFDVVIIDTGPILGSVEAALLAQEVDGVILAVARGRDRGMVRNAMRRLQELGARTVGFVFNRAAGSDFEQSTYSSQSVRTAPTGGLLPRPAAVNGNGSSASRPPRLKEFGPLVTAVASGVPDEN
jgi:capsular exopolysaccharide synthesis family protein